MKPQEQTEKDESLSAYMFINFKQALGFGHITWGFETAPGQFFYGSTDHLLRRPMWDLIALMRYSAVEPGGDIDYWSAQGSLSDMLAEMSRGPHIWYHAYKKLTVPASAANPDAARELAESLKDGGWRLLDNNCVHQTHRVLRAFGAGEHMSVINHPWQAPTPVDFFGRAHGVAGELEKKVSLRSCR